MTLSGGLRRLSVLDFFFLLFWVRMETTIGITMNNKVKGNEEPAERHDRWKQGVECRRRKVKASTRKIDGEGRSINPIRYDVWR